MTPKEAYQFGLLPLVIWREARNQEHKTKVAVGWSIRNRIEHPKWWGFDYPSTIMMRWQYSSFNAGDPNFTKFPGKSDESQTAWEDSLAAAWEVFNAEPEADSTLGSTNYFDRSLDKNPPAWAAKMVHTVDIGAFHFFKESV